MISVTMGGKSRKRPSTDIPDCKYGLDCYQKNPQHRKKFRHPESVTEQKNANPESVTELKNANPESVSEQKNNLTPEKEISDFQNNTETTESQEKISSEAKFAETVGEVLKSMPADFFEFWNFCKTINELKPEDAFSELGLQLTGIYDILSKQLSKTKKVVLHCHYRYYYDPPEFQTVITSSDKDLYHIGYFRDEPDKHPSVLVSNSAASGPKLTLKGDNIFAAMNTELTGRLKKLKQTALRNKFSKTQENLQKYAKGKKYSLEISTAKTKARSKKVNSKTFNDFGIVVPVANDVGYRPLPDSNATVKSVLKRIVSAEDENKRLEMEESLDELITNVQFANDECDFGMGLELGIDLFAFGDPYFHSHILSILPLAYKLLNRPKYAEVVEFHLRNRKKSGDLNALD